MQVKEKKILTKEMLKEKMMNIYDHRLLGKRLGLFKFFSSYSCAGLPMWLKGGTIIKKEIENFISKKEEDNFYYPVETPIIGNVNLYERTGHWNYYKENFFPPVKLSSGEFVIRPMACPHHFLIYEKIVHSYRDLPFRISEKAVLWRNESSGSIIGIERTKMMKLFDAHVFLQNEDLVDSEFKRIFFFTQKILDLFKIKIDHFSLSLREKGEKYEAFSEKNWKKSEKMIKKAIKSLGIECIQSFGNAAFYGPKLDFQVKTDLGHLVTLATIQLDLNLPLKFGLKFVDANMKEKVPIVIHHSIIGTIERFISVLLEQKKGILPLWLAPVQVVLIPVGKSHIRYCKNISDKMTKINVRVLLDDRARTVSYRVKDAQRRRINYIVTIGDKEKLGDFLSYRVLQNKKICNSSLTSFVFQIQKEMELKI